MNHRLASIIRKEFIQIWRDPRTLVIILIIPIMQLFLLGYSATSDIKNVQLVVLDQSRSAESRALLDSYRAADYFVITQYLENEEEARALIEKGEARATLIIPPDFSERLAEGEAQVSFILDGSDPTVASTSLSSARLIGQAHATEILSETIASTGQKFELQPPVDVRTNVWYNPDLISAYFMIPGVIGMILFAITAILTATAVVRERERGTIEQLIVTPIRSWELIIGKITPYVLLAFLDMIEVLAIGHWWFGVPIRGSLGLILITSGIFLLSGLGIGLFASTVANTQQEAMLIVWMTLLPAIFLSGFFFPIQAMPQVLQWISLLMPLRYYLVIIRALLLKGVGLEMILNQVLALIAFAVVIMTAASIRFHKRLD
jgi:ABC-2 type transport system permease protein